MLCGFSFHAMNIPKMVQETAMIKLVNVTVTDMPGREKCEQQVASELTPVYITGKDKRIT